MPLLWGIKWAVVVVFTIARDSNPFYSFPILKVFGRFGTLFSKWVPRLAPQKGSKNSSKSHNHRP